MLRQIHIFYNREHIFVKDYAIAFGNTELRNIQDTIDKYMRMPVPGKIINRKVSNFQLFHKGIDDLYFLLVTDLIDSLHYIEEVMEKIISKFQDHFPTPLKIKDPSSEKNNFVNFLNQLQKDLHSKITIIGPTFAGKTTLYNLLKGDEEESVMDFATSATIKIEDLYFELWNFRLKDNFSNLWPKIIRGSDLVILLFNLANYNLKILDHFMNMYKIENNLAKLLIIGNKRELVDDDDIRRIKNELNRVDFKEISLNTPDAKSQIFDFIKESLGLKEGLPPNFEDSIKEAERLEAMGNQLQALAKYRDLIKISSAYQDFEHIKQFEQKITDITVKLKEQKQLRREIEKEKAFEIPKEIEFKKKIKVKPLPSTAETVVLFQKEETEEELPPPPKKLTSDMISFQKLESKPSEFKSFKPEDDSSILKKPIIPIKSTDEKPKTTGVKMPMELFTPHEDLKIETKKVENVNFIEELHRMISEKGSSLSLKLCEHLITDLAKSLGRAITFKDVKLAAEFFVKQEQMT
ncbi:MAG: ADP-ribosylation factor-like protein [Candidatus Thorarchaeota archaeon]